MEARMPWWLPLVLACAALAYAIAALAAPPPQAQAPDTRSHAQVCALMGAIMADGDSPVGLSARVARLYREYEC